MAILRVQVIIPVSTGVPEDNVVNTWHFEVPTVGSSAFAAIKTALSAFYNGWSSYRSIKYTWHLTRAKMYDMADPEPRVPVFDDVLALNTSTGSDTLPAELAMCLSYQANPIAGVPQSRRRGRIYCGPFFSGSADDAGGRPTPAVILALSAAGSALIAASQGSSEFQWVVYSPRSVELGGDPAASVIEGWVDNAWDIQRRRGLDATARTPFS